MARSPSAYAFCMINDRRTSGWRVIGTRGAPLGYAITTSSSALTYGAIQAGDQGDIHGLLGNQLVRTR